jgi:hypothetical protein
MMMSLQLFDGRAVEKRRRVCGNRDVIQLPKSIVIITTDNGSVGGVVGVTGTPGDGSVGVVGVVWSPEDGLGECGIDYGSRLMVTIDLGSWMTSRFPQTRRRFSTARPSNNWRDIIITAAV